MTIEQRNEGREATLLLEGRMDTTTAPELEKVLLPVLDEYEEVVLDFENLAYVSSAGLRVLLAGQKKANKLRKDLIITHVNDVIMDVFEVTGFADILNLE